MVQYLHLITNAALRLPNDLWFPSGADLKPSSSWQGEFGLEWKASKKLSVNLDAYYKKMDQLYAYPDDRSFLGNIDIDDPNSFITEGEGRAYGLECLLNYQGEKTGGIISYALTNAERRYNGHNEGSYYPHEYDQRHQLKLFFYKKIGDRLMVNASWIYNSPNPQWGLENTNLALDIDIETFNPPGRKNQSRSKVYQRLDLDVQYNFKKSKLEHRIKLGAYNVYNHENIAYYQADLDDNNGSFTEPIPSLPFLPSLGYSIKF